jgi:hypothetical protein
MRVPEQGRARMLATMDDESANCGPAFALGSGMAVGSIGVLASLMIVIETFDPQETGPSQPTRACTVRLNRSARPLF